MSPNKYKPGDLVEDPSGYVYRIVKVLRIGSAWLYNVELKTSMGGFIASHKQFREDFISFHLTLHEGSKEYVPKSPQCPKCSSKWLITGFGRRKYYDCPTCKKQAEELEKSDSPPKTWSYL